MTKNDKAWEIVFEKKKLLTKIKKQEYVYITADELKGVGGREPRLMAKMDTLESRPTIFKDNNLTIFPTKNGEYIIFSDNENKSYFRLDPQIFGKPATYHPQISLSNFDTFYRTNQFSESQALDYAFICSLLKTFTADLDLHLTLRGRLRSGAFKFKLPKISHTVNVKGVQIEVDSGYESRKKVVLFEAKIGKRDNFHIRQLYYPYLEWSQRTSKEIIPIFFEYSNGLYYFTQLEFNKEFGNLNIVKNKCFIVDEPQKVKITKEFIKKIVPQKEPVKIPFPQADDLDKVVDIVRLVKEGIAERDEIADYFEFNVRQGDYYANAAAYLNLVKKHEKEFILTKEGEEFTQISSRLERNKQIFKQMLQVPSLRDIALFFMQYDFDFEKVDRRKIEQIVSKHKKS